MKAPVWIPTLLIAIRFFLSLSGFGAQAAMGTGQSANSNKAASVKGRPSAQAIADAKVKGLVWVNTATRVYHKEGPSYGTTKLGKFMTEDEAKKAGFRMAREPKTSKRQPDNVE